jgi:hypothetical protein
VSRKPPTKSKNSLDIPPVPASTRFIIQEQNLQPAHLGPWVGDLLGIEYEEVDLEKEYQSKSRLFVERKKRIAVHLTDALFISEAKRLSATNLSIIENDAYLTIHLAIASQETIKSTIILLQQNPPRNDEEYQAQQLLNRFINLQNSTAILEAYQYEKFLIQEVQSGSPWGASLFSSLVLEQAVAHETLSQKQLSIYSFGTTTAASKNISQFFISLFASQELRNSYPNLAQYSTAIIPAGLETSPANLTPWAQAVIQEWTELTETELQIAYPIQIEERDMAAHWLKETIEAFMSQATG